MITDKAMSGTGEKQLAHIGTPLSAPLMVKFPNINRVLRSNNVQLANFFEVIMDEQLLQHARAIKCYGFWIDPKGMPLERRWYGVDRIENRVLKIGVSDDWKENFYVTDSAIASAEWGRPIMVGYGIDDHSNMEIYISGNWPYAAAMAAKKEVQGMPSVIGLLRV